MICLIWDCSKFVPQPPLPSPKKAVKLNLGCPDSVLSIFFDFSWGFIFCSAPMGHGGWEPDSVPIKSGPPRSNWNFQGDATTITIVSGNQPLASDIKGITRWRIYESLLFFGFMTSSLFKSLSGEIVVYTV